MKTLALIFLAIMGLALIGLMTTNKKDYSEWEQWKLKYNKSYTNDLEIYRREVFYKNLLYIQITNARQNNYVLGQNKLMDLTTEEFSKIYLGDKNMRPAGIVSNESEPENSRTVDWRKKGAVTAVKDQGNCGSCWSFGTTGGLEGAQKLFGTGELQSFAEQQLVDCSWDYGNMGCNGGFTKWAFEYVMAHGIVTEDKYPYTAKDGNCKIDQGPFKITSYYNVTEYDCNDLYNSVDKLPTSVSVDATNWHFYQKGVFDDCEKNTNHAVLAVGYKPRKYWIVKNSWSADWGEDGYIRLKPGDTCGICTHPSYPIV